MSKHQDPTAAQRKAAERARDQSAGIAEVRGIKAPIALHPAIKQAAREVIANEPCFCDRQQIGVPGVSCGDCPRDYAPTK